MTDPASVEDRLPGALRGATTRPLPPAAPLAAVRLGARRRRRRHVFAGIAPVVLLVTALAFVVDRRDGAIGPADRIDRLVLEGGAPVPTWTPPGFRFAGGAVQGPGGTPEPGRLVLLTDPIDPNRFVRVETWNTDVRSVAQITQSFIDSGAFSAADIEGAGVSAYAVRPHGALFLTWTDTAVHDVSAFGVTLRQAEEVARWAVTRGDRDLPPVAGLTVVHDAPRTAQGARIDLNWRPTDESSSGSLDLTVAGNDWMPPSARWGAAETVRKGPWVGQVWESGELRIASWMDGNGVVRWISASGVPRDEVLLFAASLVPADETSWSRLRRSGTYGMTDLDGPAPASAATTAVATPTPPAATEVDYGSARDVPVGGWRTESQGAFAIVRTGEDTWVGLVLQLETGVDGTCVAQPVERDGAFSGWAAPCVDAVWAPDGACANDRCFVGLRRFGVRVVDGRIVGTPERTTPGAAAASVLG